MYGFGLCVCVGVNCTIVWLVYLCLCVCRINRNFGAISFGSSIYLECKCWDIRMSCIVYKIMSLFHASCPTFVISTIVLCSCIYS